MNSATPAHAANPGPPDDVLGAALPVSRLLARGDDGVAALAGAWVYPSGLLFELILATRRNAQGQDEWAELREELAMTRYRRGIGGPRATEVELHADGLVLGLTDPRPSPEQAGPSTPLLTLLGGSYGKYTEELILLNHRLWCQPSPSGSGCELVVRCPPLFAGEASAAFPADQLRAGTARCEPFWP